MRRALHRIAEKGFHEATIGVERQETHLIHMYQAWGFTTYLKTKTIDHHGFTEDRQSKTVRPYDLYLNQLQQSAKVINVKGVNPK